MFGMFVTYVLRPEDIYPRTLVWDSAQYERLIYALEGRHGRESYNACWRYVIGQLERGIASLDGGTLTDGSWSQLDSPPPA